MARHLHNIQCPKCATEGRDRGKDNLGVYDDGSCYCYRCGYYKHGTIGSRLGVLGEQLRQPVVSQEIPVVALPPDSDTYIPAVARMWLGKYGITEYEIVANKLLWSERYEALIFPYFDKWGNLLAWQARNFAEEGKGFGKHKWFSQGNLKTLFHILPAQEHYNSVVFVEDIVSAIKLSRYTPALPVFTSRIGLDRFRMLYNRLSEVKIWLDPNMRKQSIVEANIARTFGLKAAVIFSDKDPKEHNDDEIRQYLL